MAGCIDRKILRTLKYIMATGDLTTGVDGHDYKEIDSEDPNISVLICKDCGHVDISWLYNEVSEAEQKELQRYYQKKIKNNVL